MAPLHSYCILHPGSQVNPSGKFQYDSTHVRIEVPSSDSSGDPYDDSGIAAGTGEEDVIVFDHVFPPKTSQEKIFHDIARSHVRNALQAFQSAIFIASGATGSGKTFAVTGGAQRFSDRGLIPRSVSALFEAMDGEPEREDVEVSVSFYELYKDAVVDLLSERRRKVPIKPTEKGPQLVGLLRQVVSTESDAYHLLFQGDSNRHFQSFAQNSETSRGHVFYLLHVSHRFSGKRAVLAFVDLAAPIAVRNPANTAIAQSLDALKATLLALRDGREAFWESSILPQLLEPWLGPKSTSTVVLLSPVRYCSDQHQEAHEWLTFTRLAQEAYCGNPLSSQLQKNWSGKDGKVLHSALQLPASFKEPGVVEKKEEPPKEELQSLEEPKPKAASQASFQSLSEYPQLSQTSFNRSQPSVVTSVVTSQPNSERKADGGVSQTASLTEAETQKVQTNDPCVQPEGPSLHADPPGSDWSPEGPRVEAQYTSGMVTPPPPVTKKPVSPLGGARSPIAAAIEVLRDVPAGDRMTQAVTQPVSPDRPIMNGTASMPQVQAMPPLRHASPLRQIVAKQASLVPPAAAPNSPGDVNQSAAGRPAAVPIPTPSSPPTAGAPPMQTMQRPSTLAVQQQQKEMQYLQNLKRHVAPVTQGAPFVRSPSPTGSRVLRSAHAGPASYIPAPSNEAQVSGYASPMVQMAGAVTPTVSGVRTPFATYTATRSESPMSPMAYQAQARSVSPMAARPFGTAPVAATAMPCQRYGAFMQPCQAQMHAAAPMQVQYSAVMMGQARDMIRPISPQVPVAFKVAPPANFTRAPQAPPQPQQNGGTPRKAATTEPSRSVSPLPAGTMERVRGVRLESKP